MSTEKMNAEFEIWRKDQIASLVRTGHAEAARAFRDLGSIHWMVWQSAWTLSRVAIEVELPKCEYADSASEYSKGHRQGIRACRESIESLGLKIKQ